VENAAYGPTNCAERTAFFSAICAGDRSFSKIAIVGGMENTEGNKPCAPCGVCRQVMAEFCDAESFKIILENGENEPLEYTLKELLPLGFGPGNLN
jgi:cytidine deaminase